jgi:hypothetical protein
MRFPQHSTVVSYCALFVALGGTAYAATGGNFVLGHSNQAGQTSSLTNTGSGPALRLATHRGTTPPLAVSNDAKIARLNADELDGLSSTAFQRKIAAISASTTSGHTVPAGSAGPWTMSMRCRTDRAIFTIKGPGSAGGATTIATGVTAGNTFVDAMAAIGADGFTKIADQGQQESFTLFLKSGAKLAEVNLMLTAGVGAPIPCVATGTAVLTP